MPKEIRQAMKVSGKELRNLADELLKEGKELEQKLGLNDKKILNRRWSIPIVNKIQASDTWEIEK